MDFDSFWQHLCFSMADFGRLQIHYDKIFFFGNKVVKEFISRFSKIQTINFGELGRNDNELNLAFISEENGEWRCNVNVNKIEILEEKNVKTLQIFYNNNG